MLHTYKMAAIGFSSISRRSPSLLQASTVKYGSNKCDLKPKICPVNSAKKVRANSFGRIPLVNVSHVWAILSVMPRIHIIKIEWCPAVFILPQLRGEWSNMNSWAPTKCRYRYLFALHKHSVRAPLDSVARRTRLFQMTRGVPIVPVRLAIRGDHRTPRRPEMHRVSSRTMGLFC